MPQDKCPVFLCSTRSLLSAAYWRNAFISVAGKAIKPVPIRRDVQSVTMNKIKCVLLAEVCRSCSTYKGHTTAPLCRCRLTHFLQSEVARTLSPARQPVNSSIEIGTYQADHGTHRHLHISPCPEPVLFTSSLSNFLRSIFNLI
jgi:hypothetical protein